MSSIDLGFTVRDYSKMEPATSPAMAGEGKKVPTKTEYPCLTIPGNSELAKALHAGQEFTATVTFRVAEVTIRDRAADDTGNDEDDEDEGGEEDEPVDQYSGTRVELQAKSMILQGVMVKEQGSEEADGSTAISKFFKGKAKAANNAGD